MLLDEMSNKGYGVTSSISLIIATNVCESIFWSVFSPMTIQSQNKTEYQGSVVALFHSLLTKDDKMSAF